MEYQLMKIANKTDITKLDKRYNHIVLKNMIPDFLFFESQNKENSTRTENNNSK